MECLFLITAVRGSRLLHAKNLEKNTKDSLNLCIGCIFGILGNTEGNPAILANINLGGNSRWSNPSKVIFVFSHV